jgi:hypothetical protein
MSSVNSTVPPGGAPILKDVNEPDDASGPATDPDGVLEPSFMQGDGVDEPMITQITSPILDNELDPDAPMAPSVDLSPELLLPDRPASEQPPPPAPGQELNPGTAPILD